MESSQRNSTSPYPASQFQLRIPPHEYVHVLDTNTNVSRLVCGPCTSTCQEHERFCSKIMKMIAVPRRHYCVIENPVVRRWPEGEEPTFANSEVLFDDVGQAKLHHGDKEVRLEQDPFPLYPGERIAEIIKRLPVVAENCALRLEARIDFFDKYDKKKRAGGEQWLFQGPATFYPQVEVEIVQTVSPITIEANEALALRARKDYIGSNGVERKCGEIWMVRSLGLYLPEVDEEVVEKVRGYVLTPKKALALEAIQTFLDIYGKERRAGNDWLVTLEDAPGGVHIPEYGFESVIGETALTTLTSNDYCVISNPYDEETGKYDQGKKRLVVGHRTFFRHPGEKLVIERVIVLTEDEAVIVQAMEDFVDNSGRVARNRRSGQRWWVYGPCRYIPPIEVRVIRRRKALYIENVGAYFVTGATVAYAVLALSALFVLYTILNVLRHRIH